MYFCKVSQISSFSVWEMLVGKGKAEHSISGEGYPCEGYSARPTPQAGQSWRSCSLSVSGGRQISSTEHFQRFTLCPYAEQINKGLWRSHREDPFISHMACFRCCLKPHDFNKGSWSPRAGKHFGGPHILHPPLFFLFKKSKVVYIIFVLNHEVIQRPWFCSPLFHLEESPEWIEELLPLFPPSLLPLGVCI